MERWQSNGGRKICLAINDLESLKLLMGKSKSAGLITHLIKDAGHTEIPPGTITVVGLGPGTRSDIDSITSSLPLVK